MRISIRRGINSQSWEAVEQPIEVISFIAREHVPASVAPSQGSSKTVAMVARSYRYSVSFLVFRVSTPAPREAMTHVL